MPRGVKKADLPTKICVVCNRPFNWRKKWEKVWDEVTTCSKSCNRKRRALNQQANRMTALEGEDSDKNDYTQQESDGTTQQDVLHFISDMEAFMNNNSSDSCTSDEEASDDNSNTHCNVERETTMSVKDVKAARKAAKKRMKAERRARREGRGDQSVGQKPCDICGKSVDLLIRCRTDATLEWRMVCGKCWHDVSGGVVDGDALHPYYQYGGLWKNRAKV